ncbi:hypothetical protein AURDEDRAFT_110122 [Auricularia subglabra TFB-10046 SS5]|nr:hypothetical protein AURDEDRAFT_110122 [Auricularia subglabra TFB-10046 SS5]
MSYNQSSDALHRPLSNPNYSRAPGNEGEYYNQGSYNNKYGYPPVAPARKRKSAWVRIGIPIALLLVIAAVVVGVVVALRNKKDKNSDGSSGGSGNGSGGNGGNGGPNANVGTFATSTDAYFLPVYPTQANPQLYVAPAFAPSASATAAWPAETFKPATPDPKTVRDDRPRLLAPAYKWQALPDLIKKDAYLSSWHNRILNNATQYLALPAVQYFMDGGSGILDNCREVKQRVKAFAYAYRMTQEDKWLQGAWRELQNAAGLTDAKFGEETAPDRWNSNHFLDTAEMTSAFAIAYDWLYDSWTADQRSTIMTSIIDLGLKYGVDAYGTADYGWWTGRNGEIISGNWNCVSNAGMTMGALAILNDDQSGIASQILDNSIANAKKNCVLGPSSDGTWTETPNYWYFGTTGHAEMASALISATGSDYGLLDTNENFKLTGLFHMYVFGMTSLFDFADHGPNKYSSTANSMLFYGSVYQEPRYILHQRDRFDAAEPWSMFWYDPTVTGAWWNGLELDHGFTNPETYWGSMRSSWTDNRGVYVAMKSSKLVGHQTHGDLDCGDFVLDAMGQRWAGELGSGDYLSKQYFQSEADDALRWLYYRKRTEGQNTILINGANQLAEEAAPSFNFGSSGTAQGSDPVLSITSDSTAFMTTDMSTAYASGSSVQRGIRLINGRRQVLVQDDITASDPIMWRMHTNATIDLNGSSATLKLDGETLQATILSPQGANFETMRPVRLSTDPPLPTDPQQTDQENKGVTVLVINVPAGQTSIQVLFNPQWNDFSSDKFISPKSVPVSQWSVESHS